MSLAHCYIKQLQPSGAKKQIGALFSYWGPHYTNENWDPGSLIGYENEETVLHYTAGVPNRVGSPFYYETVPGIPIVLAKWE